MEYQEREPLMAKANDGRADGCVTASPALEKTTRSPDSPPSQDSRGLRAHGRGRGHRRHADYHHGRRGYEPISDTHRAKEGEIAFQSTTTDNADLSSTEDAETHQHQRGTGFRQNDLAGLVRISAGYLDDMGQAQREGFTAARTSDMIVAGT